ncbi:Predicted metalloprotease [Amycolatopsis marina]|uniref:Predicted metalloprotease n=1 Tax=Amycolatopsis marina TaxID=490629 RepID=A0A1I0YSR4_9PSEU|nr:neutral zinc metallopeptidase [Amycolatopsis marina]SFB16241.1 Predicted metalloprotease [Amycolatopsis marina]
MLALLALLGNGCAAVGGTAHPSSTIVADTVERNTASLVDPGFVRGSDGGEIDRLAATVLTDVQDYWRQRYPEIFGDQWQELDGGFHSSDTADAGATAPPCTEDAAVIAGNAYYCPSEDVIVWDRAALLPVLTERYGAGAVMLVLAHEIGHAVQQRAGIARGQADTGGLYPTIVTEAMADCYAGAFLRWVVDGEATHLRLEPRDLDPALRALITFRDPVGTGTHEQGAHGDAFDRVSAFQDGYAEGAQPCSEMTARNREFTQREFTSMADLERGGNLPLPDLVNAMSADLGPYFTGLVEGAGGQWTPPPLDTVDSEPSCSGAAQGAAAYCPDARAVRVWADATVREVHTSIGDYGTGTLLASRYALAALHATGRPVEGAKAQRAVLCLTGAYTGSLLRPERDFTVSPGDLDEAVQVLLGYEYPARDVAGAAIGSGYERVAAFRDGVTDGPGSCGLG